jgi:Flp pilus assembly protein TadD
MKHFFLIAWWWAAGFAEPPEAMTLARRAYEQAKAGQFEEAASGLREAARLAPANSLFRSALGGVLERQGKTAEAVAAFTEAMRLDPANVKVRERLESLSLEWGAALARERRYRAGLMLARESAARFPKSEAAHIMLGLFCARNQQNLAAVDAYRRALTINRASAEASVGLGIAQSSAGLSRDAQATFEAGLQAFPADAMHRQAYGVLLVKMAEAGEAPAQRAAAMLEAALELNPKLAEAHYQLGNLALARGDAAAAISHFDAAQTNGLDDSRLHYAAARALRRAGRDVEADRRLELFRVRKAAEEKGQ